MSLDAAVAAFRGDPSLLRLVPRVHHYKWGGLDFIPRLIGVGNPERQPFAELWIGAHPLGPCTVAIGEGNAPSAPGGNAPSAPGGNLTLAELIARAPRETLGAETSRRFGNELPYLLKVLDARSPLSIQAHPSRDQAREGFARENAAGIPLDAPGRNYRDANHKPEVHVVLSEFRMLHGFRPLEQMAEMMSAVPEVGAVMPDFVRRLDGAGWDPQARTGVLRDLYERIMTMPQERVDAHLAPLIARLERECPSDKDNPDFWALAASRASPLPGGSRDRGIFSIYLLNLVRLRPGQATFQPAGTLHAYLEGVTVELMASSDNVLRGGLTPKHVDVRELLRTLSFEPGEPAVMEGTALSPSERVYAAPVDDFLLSRIEVGKGRSNDSGSAHGPECLIVCEGAALARTRSGAMELPRGAAVFVPAAVPYTLEPDAQGARSVIFRAGVPPCTKS